MRAERYAREKKLDVIGYYHSHPESPAVPSQYDLDHALPVWSYVIASVIKGEVVDIRSWEMENDRSKFNEEDVERRHPAGIRENGRQDAGVPGEIYVSNNNNSDAASAVCGRQF